MDAGDHTIVLIDAAVLSIGLDEDLIVVEVDANGAVAAIAALEGGGRGHALDQDL